MTIRHILRDCTYHKGAVYSRITKTGSYTQRLQQCRSMVSDKSTDFFDCCKPAKTNPSMIPVVSNEIKKNIEINPEEKKENLHPLFDLLQNVEFVSVDSSGNARAPKRLNSEMMNQNIEILGEKSENEVESEKKKQKKEKKEKEKKSKQTILSESDLFDADSMEVFKLLDDNLCLSGIPLEKREKIVEIADFLVDSVKESNKRRKETKENRKLSLSSLIHQGDPSVQYIIKRLLQTESHIRKRVKPMVKMAKQHLVKPMTAEKQEIFNQHAFSVRKRLCASVVLTNQIINAGCCKESTSLKLIATCAFREAGMTNKEISRLSNIGITHSNNNYLKLFQQKSEFRKILLEKREELREPIKNATFAMISDNKRFEIKKKNLRKPGCSGVDTVSIGIFYLKNPDKELLSLEKKFSPIPMLSREDFASKTFECSEEESVAMGVCWKEHFDIVKNKKSLLYYLNDNGPQVQDIDYQILPSLLGLDVGVENNIRIIKTIDEFFKTELDMEQKDSLSVHVGDQKGHQAITKAMYGNLPENLKDYPISSIPFDGDWHLVVNALDGCNVFYDNFLFDFGCVLDCSNDWSIVSSANGKYKVASNINTIVFHFAIEKLLHHFESLLKKPIESISDLLYICEKDLLGGFAPNDKERMKESETLAKEFLKAKLAVDLSSELSEKQLEECTMPFLKRFMESSHISLNQKSKKADIVASILDFQKKAPRTQTAHNFHNFKMENLMNFDILSKPQIQRYCRTCQILAEGSVTELIAGLKRWMSTYSIQIDPKMQFLTNCYVYVRNYGCVPIFLYQAIRTNNWNLRMAVLKGSIRLFQCGKPLYLNLVTDHLFHYQNLYPPFFKELMKKMWVMKTKTTKNYMALDEYMEMKHNLYLKNAVKVAEGEHIKAVSTLAPVSTEMSKLFHSFLGSDEAISSRKSNDLEWDFVKALEDLKIMPTGMHISSSLELGRDVEDEELVELIGDVIGRIKPSCFAD